MPIDPARLTTPAAYPLQLSPDGTQACWLQMDEAAYRSASFLDARLLQQRAPLWTNWSAFATAAERLASRAHFIFHIGHVGSTLLSRLLGEHPKLFSVREPALLRTLATEVSTLELRTLVALFARVWRPDQTALIKATSFVGEIAPQLLAAAEGGRAILLSTTPPAYLRTILAGDASRQEMDALASFRSGRLEQRLGPIPMTDALGERIAMSWLAGVLALNDAADSIGARSLWLDFDRLLDEPALGVRVALQHLGVDPADMDVQALVAGPMMQRYAKAPEHAYDRELRRDLLKAAGEVEQRELQRGMAWLQRTAESCPGIRPALLRAAAAARTPLVSPPPRP